MKILFLGDSWYGSNAKSMAQGFASAGHDVVSIDTTAVTLPRKFSAPWVYRKFYGRAFPGSQSSVHSALELAAKEIKPDLLFCFKSIFLNQEAILSLPVPIKVHYSPDDVSNRVNVSSQYLRFESEWDAVYTTKRHNVSELKSRGVVNAHFIWSAYDPTMHYKASRTRLEKYLVGFVGNHRPDRSNAISTLAEEFGKNFYLAGPGWEKNRRAVTLASFESKGHYGHYFSSSIANIAGNLVLLNSDNRDQHTCRSFEVPAAGGLFVGERTSEHLELLADGEEAAMFSSFEELLEILARLKCDEKWGSRMAERGYRAITNGRNTYRDRALEILKNL